MRSLLDLRRLLRRAPLFFASLLLIAAGSSPVRAQTIRELQLSVSAGDTAAPSVSAAVASAAQLPQTLSGSSSNGDTGYQATRSGSARLERADTLADGLKLGLISRASFSDADASSIPALGALGSGPSAGGYVRVQNERIDFALPEGASSMRVRVHGALLLDASGLLGTNRPWNAAGTTQFTISGSVKRRSNNATQSSFSTGFNISQAATSDQGALTTTTNTYWGKASGTGAWNTASSSGEGYVEFTVTSADYAEFTVQLYSNAYVAGFARSHLISGEALAKFENDAAGRLWLTLPDGGSAVATLGGLARRAQTLTFPAVSALTVDSEPVTLGATASSGLPVSYTVTEGPASVSGNVLTLDGVRGDGYLRIVATQAGDADVAPASATQFVSLAGRAQTIEFPELASRPANSAPFAPGATASSGLAVVYQVVSGPASTDGTLITLSGSTGSVRLRATQPGDSVHEPAPAVERYLTVTAATDTVAQTITFPSLLSAEVGVGQLLQATASSGLTVNYEVVAGSATLTGPNQNILTATAAGLVTVRASQPGGVNEGITYAAAVSVERSFTATGNEPSGPVAQTVDFLAVEPMLSGDTRVLYASASSGLPIVFTLESGRGEFVTETLQQDGAYHVTFRALGSGPAVIRASQAGGTEGGVTYLAASATRTVTIDPRPQTVELPDVHLLYVGVPSLLDSGDSPRPVTYRVVRGPASIGGPSRNVLTGTAPGLVQLRAVREAVEVEGVAYAASEPVERVLTVEKPAVQTILNLSAGGTLTYGAPPVSLAGLGGESSAGLPLAYAIVSGPGVIEDGAIRLTGAGTVRLRVTQSGGFGEDDIYYAAARPVETRIVVQKAPLLIRAGRNEDAIDATRVVGAALPAVEFTYEGFVNNDTPSSALSSQPRVRSNATLRSPAGLYALIPHGALSANYAITYESGVLLVVGWGGSYEALLNAPGGDTPVGKLVLTVSANGLGYSGRLSLAEEAKDIAVSGALAPQDFETATAAWQRPASRNAGHVRYEIELTVSDGLLQGRVIRPGADDLALDFGSRVPTYTLASPAPQTGVHTLVLPPFVADATTETNPLPHGAGYATAVIDLKGRLKLSGRLGDGTVLSATIEPGLYLGATPLYRVFVRPYGARADSCVAGTLLLQPHPDLAGRFHVPLTTDPLAPAGLPWGWQKSGRPGDATYSAGFSTLMTFPVLDPWLPPVKAAPARGQRPAIEAVTLIERLGLGEGDTSVNLLTAYHDPADEADDIRGLSAANLLSLPPSVTLDPAGRLVAAPASDNTRYAINSNTGLLTGSFRVFNDVPAPIPTDQDRTRTVRRDATVRGILRQPPSTESGDSFVAAAHYTVKSLNAGEKPTTGEIRLLPGGPASTP